MVQQRMLNSGEGYKVVEYGAPCSLAGRDCGEQTVCECEITRGCTCIPASPLVVDPFNPPDSLADATWKGVVW